MYEVLSDGRIQRLVVNGGCQSLNTDGYSILAEDRRHIHANRLWECRPGISTGHLVIFRIGPITLAAQKLSVSHHRPPECLLF
jgi:hypothetical protein